MKLDCYLISISVFVVYCLVVYLIFGMHRSISNTYYTLNKYKLFQNLTPNLKVLTRVYLALKKYKLFRNLNCGIFFHMFIFGISVPIIIASNENNISLTMSGMLIALVGFTANTKDEKIREQIHVLGATGGIVAGNIAMIEQIARNIITEGNWTVELFARPYLYSLLLLIAITIYIYKKPVKNTTTWEEIAAYMLIILPFLTVEI